MARIIEVLERLGELDWYAVRPSELTAGGQIPTFRPLITLRYKEGNDRAYRLITDALTSYRGKGVWTVTGAGGKNLCLMPEAVRQASDTGTGTMDAVDAMIRNDHSFVRLALNDYQDLLNYLDECFRGPEA